MDINSNLKSESRIYAKQYAEFTTVTCLEWKPVLEDNRFKDIITNSMSFLRKDNRAIIYGFAIMSNHFHMIWQILGDYKREDVQRDFLKYTGQQILKVLRNENSSLQNELLVNVKDRKRQVWERNSLGIPLWSTEVIWQKLDYIHDNPVKAGLCEYAEDYHYSSAEFYRNGTKHWDFLTHVDG
ncbi:MAG TPA: transposase [Cyclobacteriaceae bacterium]|nr:transposase [Cyclobacteriaceae bacterium]